MIDFPQKSDRNGEMSVAMERPTITRTRTNYTSRSFFYWEDGFEASFVTSSTDKSTPFATSEML